MTETIYPDRRCQNTEFTPPWGKILTPCQRKLFSTNQCLKPARTNQQLNEKDQNVKKVTHRFPLPPGCAGNEAEGGRSTLNDKRISGFGGGWESSSSAAAWSKHFQRLSLIEKVCFHLSQISEWREEGKEMIAMSWGDEEEKSDSAFRGEIGECEQKTKRKWGNDRVFQQTNAIRGDHQAGCWEGKQPTTLTPPTACQ